MNFCKKCHQLSEIKKEMKTIYQCRLCQRYLFISVKICEAGDLKEWIEPIKVRMNGKVYYWCVDCFEENKNEMKNNWKKGENSE